MLPAKVVEFVVPRVSVLAPRVIALPLTPVRSWIVWLPPPEMSKVAPEAATLIPLDAASEPPPPSASVPALIVVGPM